MVGGLGMIRRQPAESSYFLAFVSYDKELKVYRMLPDGTHLKRLTNIQIDPPLKIVWSPDAYWIAIEYGYKIFITSSYNQQSYQIVPEIPETQVFDPIWSPDSTALLYTYLYDDPTRHQIRLFQISDRQEKIFDFYAIGWFRNAHSFLASDYDSSNSQLYEVSRDGKIIKKLTYIEGYSIPIAMSPDNQWVLVAKQETTLYLMSLGDKEILQLASSERERLGRWNVAWSPDSQWIVFVSDQSGRPELYRIGWDGTDLLQLSEGDFSRGSYGYLPFGWSPNGKWLVYEGMDGIYKISWDGTQKQRLTEFSCYNADSFGPQVTWSPDGKWIAYVASDCNYNLNIYRVSADGQKHNQLTHNSTEIFYAHPTWSPPFSLNWHGFALAALGCGASVLGCLLRFLKKWQHQPF
jgi:Tol biopolymer transport system component